MPPRAKPPERQEDDFVGVSFLVAILVLIALVFIASALSFILAASVV